MFGLSIFEIIILAVIALVFIGPQRLPEVMRQGGKLFVQLRRTANDVRSTFDSVIKDAEEDIRKTERDKFVKLFEQSAAQTALTQEKHPPLVDDHPTVNLEHDVAHHVQQTDAPVGRLGLDTTSFERPLDGPAPVISADVKPSATTASVLPREEAKKG